MNVWEIAILKSIKSLGGEAQSLQICEIFSNYFEEQLTKKHLRITYGRLTYYHHVRKRISILWRKKGELKKISWGRYSLTEKGIKRIDSGKKKMLIEAILL